MIILGIGILIVIVGLIATALLYYGDAGCGWNHIITGLVGLTLLVLFGVSFVIFVGLSYDYVAAEYKTNIINKEFGTSYTQQEVFWAEDVIEEVRQLKRERMEVNGDLFRDKEVVK